MRLLEPFHGRRIRAILVTMVAVVAFGALTGTAYADNHALRNYEASHWPRNSAGNNVVDAWITPNNDCNAGADIPGYARFDFEGHWVAGGNSRLVSLTIINNTSSAITMYRIREIDRGGYFDLPAPIIQPHKSYRIAINRTISGPNSEFAFSLGFGDAYLGRPCGGQDWVIRP